MTTYNDVWTVMNDIDSSITKFLGVKEILDIIVERADEGNNPSVSRLADLASELLEFYINQQDEVFKKAWDVVIPFARECERASDEKLFEEVESKDSWVVPVECDGDDCVITFPDELLKKTGWKVNDVLEWIDNEDGSYSIVSTGKQAKEDWVDPYKEQMLKAGYEMVDGVWSPKE